MSDTLFDVETGVDALAGAQWRLSEIQLANWGTFDGSIYRIPVARKGHLITGPSGSGKSSLLDAIAAVLTPDKWLRFNQAAQGAGARSDQRSPMSYVRGAWSRTTDEHEDRVVSAYLRPGATWSGIVLRYDNGTDKPISLCRLFFAKGTTTSSADLADLCLLERSAIDLRELEPFLKSGIETRRIQAHWPDAVVTSGGAHARFYAKLRSLFGIEHETALQLLHKTQSAKSLDSLDQLFRDYMLERPATFDLADTAVAQFGELRDAHDHVVQLREQRDHLLRLKTASDSFDAANGFAHAARTLAEAVLAYQKRRSLSLAHAEHAAITERLTGLALEAERADAAASRSTEDYDIAHRRTLELGGSDADQLQLRITTAKETERATIARWEALSRQLSGAGISHAPATGVEFAELMAEIERTLAPGGDAGEAGASHEQQQRYFAAKAAVGRIDSDIQTLRTTGSTVPTLLLDVRRALAEATSLPTSALPFAAELIEVRPQFHEWTGAIERVLRPLALTMLVRSEHLRAVRGWVDAHRIPVRLVFEEVTANVAPARAAGSPISLVNRVSVVDGPFSPWIASTLSDRFDVACVESVDDMDDHVRAVTIRGQIKSSRTRYEKDDRTAIDERSTWVLGDREAKLEALIELRRAAKAELDAAQKVMDAISSAQNAAQRRAGVLTAVREYEWRDIDREAAQATVAGLERRLHELTRDDGDLRAAIAAADEACAVRDRLAGAAQDARLVLRQERAKKDELSEVISALQAAIDAGAVAEVDDVTAAALDARFRAVQRSITRANIAEIGHEVSNVLRREQDAALADATTAGNTIQRLVTEFNDRWAAASVDLVPSIADRRSYLELLDEIMAHGLPDHEAKFLQLLRDRSRDLIGELVNDVLGAPREIEERVGPVNSSLRRSRFDEDRFLRLRVKVRRTDTVNRFIADLRSISDGAWSDDDRESAEGRFATLAEVMRRFASSDHIDRTWRNQCLDTRLHVTFLAEEIDEHGRAHATYDSGAAMSGGQQQKLVVFCLAAALRYQLADPDEAFSRYGTIVLDEAFDKADTRYTRMALDVFVEFGFQMVLATPQKLLQTIEPYVGAATSVENPTRRRSEVANVPWRESRP